jgi:NAD(P)H-dependent flavin oxidoreductase YrpB (nitropropane dioxygenase family)
MTELLGTDLPIAAAPMAGGASTPALVRAVTDAGGFAFLAAGYKTAAAVRAEVDALAGVEFGMNVFVPSPTPIAEPEFRRYAREIAAEGAPYDLDLAGAPLVHDDDHWQDKIDLLLATPLPVVSFTFGIPSPAVVTALRRAGTRVLITVTNPAEAAAAHEAGADGLVVQGRDAGAHSGVHDPATPIRDVPLPDLVRSCAVGPPMIAAGGITDAARVADLLSAGAAAVMVGTVLLRTDESGAAETHKNALADPSFTETVLTKAFTGRPARGLRNGFIDRHQSQAPDGYPAVHHLTRGLRTAAAKAGDTDRLHLWAGTGFRQANTGPAAAAVTALAAELA